MLQQPYTQVLAAALLATALACSGAHAADTPDQPSATTLLADMQDALVPTTAQFSRVHISAHSDQPGGGDKDWDALVIRQRDELGPRTAFSLIEPASLKGTGILTAPHPTKQTLSLWLYAPDEQRAVEFSPLEADRQFLSTRFNFEDVVLATRDTKPPVLLGSENLGKRLAWKVETRPALDRYYSRIVTWIADDDRLPLKREYYDRAGQLWKVVTYRAEAIEGIATVMAIELKDVQSRDVCAWRVDALSYYHDKLPKRVLSPLGLGAVARLDFWQKLVAIEHGNVDGAHAQ